MHACIVIYTNTLVLGIAPINADYDDDGQRALTHIHNEHPPPPSPSPATDCIDRHTNNCTSAINVWYLSYKIQLTVSIWRKLKRSSHSSLPPPPPSTRQNASVRPKWTNVAIWIAPAVITPCSENHSIKFSIYRVCKLKWIPLKTFHESIESNLIVLCVKRAMLEWKRDLYFLCWEAAWKSEIFNFWKNA